MEKEHMKLRYQNNAFTLTELLVATLLLACLFSGVMVTFFRCLELSEVSNNSTTAVLAAKSKLSEIENTDFSQISANYNNVSFNVADVNAKGVTYVTATSADVLTISVVICWKQSNGRVYGEDNNLNGTLNTGEDKNGNGQLDSIVSLTTVKYDI